MFVNRRSNMLSKTKQQRILILLLFSLVVISSVSSSQAAVDTTINSAAATQKVTVDGVIDSGEWLDATKTLNNYNAKTLLGLGSFTYSPSNQMEIYTKNDAETFFMGIFIKNVNYKYTPKFQINIDMDNSGSTTVGDYQIKDSPYSDGGISKNMYQYQYNVEKGTYSWVDIGELNFFESFAKGVIVNNVGNATLEFAIGLDVLNITGSNTIKIMIDYEEGVGDEMHYYSISQGYIEFKLASTTTDLKHFPFYESLPIWSHFILEFLLVDYWYLSVGLLVVCFGSCISGNKKRKKNMAKLSEMNELLSDAKANKQKKIDEQANAIAGNSTYSEDDFDCPGCGKAIKLGYTICPYCKLEIEWD
jgi:hypothetical protein